MVRSPVQFQKGISLNELLSLYGTEDQCFDAPSINGGGRTGFHVLTVAMTGAAS